MTLPRHVLKYLSKCCPNTAPSLNSGSDSLHDIQQVVVIPALAEKHYLFSTLASLARNESEELERTLVICVINNRLYPHTSRESLQNNLETLEMLQSLVDGRMPLSPETDPVFIECLSEILRSRLRLAYLDASSEGREMPLKQGGVGLARKLGMDAGLAVMDYESPHDGRLLCLDADSPVAKNYLSAIRRYYETHDSAAAVVGYAHPLPEERMLLNAICSYEIFLRYYVLGLNYAESPYAFHTIGSTMTCTARGYVAVRGMNRREAGEDFYFLNKLAKLVPLGKIAATLVYPSPRPSKRVPFGTGQRMNDYLEGNVHKDYFYNPQIFLILKNWFKGMETCIGDGGNHALKITEDISPLLNSFLEKNNFAEAWEGIRRTHKSQEKRAWHFKEWFDAFRTMKLVHYLTEIAYPTVGLLQALPELLEWIGHPLAKSDQAFRAGKDSALSLKIDILKNLRETASTLDT